ncbi:MAG: DUF6973 domain-containing protein [Pseudonocardia sp.]
MALAGLVAAGAVFGGAAVEVEQRPDVVLVDYYDTIAGFREGVNCAYAVGPGDCSTARDAASTAATRAQELHPTSLHNGRGDAFRHCYWNALMTRHIGRDQAAKVANNHEELADGQPAAEREMDLFNNAFGRDRAGAASTSDRDAEGRCRYSADRGELRTLR